MLMLTSIRRKQPILVSCNGFGMIVMAHACAAGNIHGMPVSFLLGIGNEIPEFSWVKRLLKTKRLVYIGLRDLDVGEKQILRMNNIKAFSMHEIDKYGIGKVVEMALDHVNPNRDLPIHLSFDVDALDPSVAPSTGTPVRRLFFISMSEILTVSQQVRGGLSFREGHYICEAISETGLLVALDLMVLSLRIHLPSPDLLSRR
jgi:arginase